MFKSVFAKYIASFMIITLFCFFAVTLTITSIVNSYSEDAKADIMNTAARSSVTYLESKLSAVGGDSLTDVMSSDGEDIENMLSVVSSNSADDITVLITDSDGAILFAVGSDKDEIDGTDRMPQPIMDELRRENSISQMRQIDTIFDSKHYVCAGSVLDSQGKLCGGVFVCASSLMLSDLVDVIVKTVILAVVLLLVASLIAVYFICERISSPLRQISKAAKSFAAGRFDVRVDVRGQDEISELAVAFNNMAESLNNYDNMRNTFISNVSHDLRSPMTSIAGFVDGMLDGVIPPEKHEYYLQIVSSEVKRLSRLVSTLLDLSRIQAGERKFTKAPFDICEMGREILISFEQKINDKSLEVDFDADEEKIIVDADRDAIYQVFYNLCDNAVKFASDGGAFRIKIEKLKGRKTVVSIYNDGQGISDADLPYVFERFYKSDKSRGLNKTGAGLGLFISKTIIDAHGEKIWVESEYEKNCCFNFTLTNE